jgi:hypothetical protein
VWLQLYAEEAMEESTILRRTFRGRRIDQSRDDTPITGHSSSQHELYLQEAFRTEFGHGIGAYKADLLRRQCLYWTSVSLAERRL